MKHIAFLALIAGMLCGCNDGPPPKVIPVTNLPAAPARSVEQETSRFIVKRHGCFEAGYQNYKREILTIEDTKTGKTFLAITDVGVIEIQNQINNDD